MPQSLQIALQNRTTSANVYCYITGNALQNGGQLVLLQSDGHSLYFPASPSSIGSPLQQDCAIPLGAPGNTVTVTIPQIGGGRIWFSVEQKLIFLLNPSAAGAALVQPSVTNPTDPNINFNWSFCEFTLNNDQLFANISYVDFISNLPIGISLLNNAGQTQYVSGTGPNGLDQVCQGLTAQSQSDGQPWDKLIVVGPNGQNLRALSPNHAQVFNPDYFKGYYEGYVTQVYQHYDPEINPAVKGSGVGPNTGSFSIDTQSGFGTVSGTVLNGNLVFDGKPFGPPSTSDIFSCSTGPFATGSDGERNAIIPRLAASFNRSTALSQTQHPSDPSTFYKDKVTNHYSRLVHLANLDGKGYAFPYDDVQPDGGADQSGKVNDGNPKLFTVTVGGHGATAQGPNEGAPLVHQDLKRDTAASENANPGGGPPAPPEQQKRKGSFLSKIFGRK